MEMDVMDIYFYSKEYSNISCVYRYLVDPFGHYPFIANNLKIQYTKNHNFEDLSISCDDGDYNGSISYEDLVQALTELLPNYGGYDIEIYYAHGTALFVTHDLEIFASLSLYML